MKVQKDVEKVKLASGIGNYKRKTACMCKGTLKIKQRTNEYRLVALIKGWNVHRGKRGKRAGNSSIPRAPTGQDEIGSWMVS